MISEKSLLEFIKIAEEKAFLNLADTWLYQRTLMSILGVEEPDEIVDDNGRLIEVIRDSVISIQSEVTELLDEDVKAGRVWKQNENGLDVEAVKEEAIDILFFVLQLLAQLFDDQRSVSEAYKEKYIKNLKRLHEKWYSNEH